MCAHQLVAILAEQQVADLRTGFNAVYFFELMRVPETDASIGCASTTDQKSMLVR
jgi:hypothetical protein